MSTIREDQPDLAAIHKDPWSLWFYWPLLGWGLALAVHAFLVFGAGGTLGKEWEERKIRQIMEQEPIK